MEKIAISPALAYRLSRYLQILNQLKKASRSRVSSDKLGGYSGINPTQIRRDLSLFGHFGRPGVGYDVDVLASMVREALGAGGVHNVALVGWGKLGRAIAASDIFAAHGFKVVAVFDRDEEKAGTSAGPHTVQLPEELAATVAARSVSIGVLAIPGAAAQLAAGELVAAGIKIILNYSDTLLDAGKGISIINVNPAGDLFLALNRLKNAG